MQKTILTALLLTLFSVASVVRAEIIELNITGLVGNSTDMIVCDSLVYAGDAVSVNAVSVRLTGTVNDLGEICCGGPEVCTGETYDWFMNWYGNVRNIDGLAAGKWVASYPGFLDQLGPFDQTGVAENQNGFLSVADGDVLEMCLYFGRASWIGECDLIRTPSGTLATVTLVLDVTYTPLPVEETTWGRVKSLFR